MSAIPRYRLHRGPAILSAGFRPFFLLAGIWAAVAIPLWLTAFAGRAEIPTAMPPAVWHVHEMVFGYGAPVVAGFMLTAIPNWTGRMPLQGGPLALLVLRWAAGRAAVLLSARLGAESAAVFDFAFPVAFLSVVAREIIAGRNWRNLPVLAALTLLAAGNLLVHFEAVGIANTAELGNRIGLATLLMLITFVGGRIIPSFTRNWLAKQRPEAPAPATFGVTDRVALALVAFALAAWVVAPRSVLAPWAELAAAIAIGARLLRWRSRVTLREPLLWVLHLGYGWLALGFLILGLNGLTEVMPETAALHALTVGAIGTMTLAVMSRASLTAGPGTTTVYLLVTLAALLRVAAPFDAVAYIPILVLAGIAWSSAFGLFVLLFAGPLTTPRIRAEKVRSI
ncbi:MAG: NnrS family protein [Alphaproteobacteria bacterium]|nr:NnrS family protein [Alphaproteobacteria bacterium]